MPGLAAIKVFFHPGARIEAGVAQLTSITQTLLRAMPPGITPPLIIQYNASSVPILQIGLSSKTLPEQALYDLGLNTLRTQMATVQGASIPLPYGGKARTIMVDLDPYALRASGLTSMDVINAVNAQNLILPAGNAKMGPREYAVRLNASTDAVQALKRPAHQGGQPAHALHPRRGQRAGRLLGAAEHRECRWQARGPGVSAQEWRSLHPGRGGPRQAAPSRDQAAAGPRGQDHVRPVALREGCGQWSGGRGHHCGVPYRLDDPALPGRVGGVRSSWRPPSRSPS